MTPTNYGKSGPIYGLLKNLAGVILEKIGGDRMCHDFLHFAVWLITNLQDFV